MSDNDRLLLDQQNGRQGSRKAHRWGKDKAAEWKDGVRREGHEWKEGLKREGQEWAEGIKQEGHEWKEGMKREGHRVADKLDGYWDKAKQEGGELEDEFENAVDSAKDEARYVAGQAKDKVGEHGKAYAIHSSLNRRFPQASQTMENLRSSVRRIPTKAKEEMDRVDDFVKDKYNSAKEAAATATDFAKAEGERIIEGAERIKNDVEDTIDSVKNNVKEIVREGVTNVNNAATHAKKAAKEKLHHAQHRIHQAGHEVKEDIQGAFNKVENAAEHTWHKFEECLGCPPRRNDVSTFRREDLNGRGYGYYDRPYGWNPVPITAFYTALSTLWFLYLVRYDLATASNFPSFAQQEDMDVNFLSDLSRKVWFARRRANVHIGDGSYELAREFSKDVTSTTINGNSKGRHTKSASPPQSDDEEPLLTSTTVHTHVAVEKPSKRLAQVSIPIIYSRKRCMS